MEGGDANFQGALGALSSEHVFRQVQASLASLLAMFSMISYLMKRACEFWQCLVSLPIAGSCPVLSLKCGPSRRDSVMETAEFG